MSSTMVPNVSDTPGTTVHTSIEGPTLSQSVDAHAHAVVSAVKDHIPGLPAAKSDANDAPSNVASNEATKEAQGIPPPRRQPSSSADAYAEQPASGLAAAGSTSAATPALEKELELKKSEVEKATAKEDKISARRKEKEDKLKAKEAERQKKLDAKRNKEQNSLQSLLAKHTSAKAASDAKRRELEEKIRQLESRSQAKQATTAAAVAAPVAASSAAAQAPAPKQAPVVSGTESAAPAAKPTPAVAKISKSTLASLSGQVAGHESGVYTTANGSLVVKPCLPLESQFYQTTLIDRPASLSKTQKSLLQRLSRYLSTYHGTLDIVDDVTNTPPTRAVIMENLIQGYKHPNVLDIKLGKQLWDESASADKRARMDEQAKTTTSGKTGVRLTGWQAWDNESSQYVKVDKAFGKSITVSQLDLGMRSFFGMGSDADSKVISDLVKTHIATVHAPTKGVERILLQNIVPAVKEIHDIVKKLEWRVRGGSILIVYEGDASILESASAKSFPPSGRTSAQKDDVIDPTKLDSLGAAAPLPRLADVRLIDFAHATFTPGKGPDDGYLTGIETTRSMLEKLAKDVRKGKVGKVSKALPPAAAAAVASKSATPVKDSTTEAAAVPADDKVTSADDKPVTSADQTLTTAPIVAASAVPVAAIAAKAAKDDDKVKTDEKEKDAKDASTAKQEKPRRFGSIFGRKNSKKTKTDEKKPQSAVEPAIKEANEPVQEKAVPVAEKQSDAKDTSVSQDGTAAVAAPPLTGAISSPSDIKADHSTEQDIKQKEAVTSATSKEEEGNIGAMAGVGSTIGAGSIILASDDDPKGVSEPTEPAQTVDSPENAVALPKEDNKTALVDDTQAAPTEKEVANLDQQKEAPTTSKDVEGAKAATSDEGNLAAAGAAVAGGAGAAALLHSSKKDDDEEEDKKKEAEKKAAAEKKEAEEKAAAEKKEAEIKAAAEKKEAERKAAEEKEAERKAAAEKKEAERKAAEEKKEAERKAVAEKKEAERKAAEEKKEAERKLALAEKQAAEEKKAKAEEEKKAKKEAEAKRLAEEKEAKEAQKAQEKEAKEAKKAQEKEAKKAAKEARKEPSQSETSDAKSENRKSGFGALFATPLAAKGASLIHSDGQTKADQDSPSVSGAPSGGVVNAVSPEDSEKQTSSEEKSGKLSALLAPLGKRETNESHSKGPSFSAAPAGAEQTSKAQGEGLERKSSKKAGLGGVFGLKRKNTSDTQKPAIKSDHEKPEVAEKAPASSTPVASADAVATSEGAPAAKPAVEAPEPGVSNELEEATVEADDKDEDKKKALLAAASALPAAALLKSSSSKEAKEAKQDANEDQPPPTPSKEEHESTGLFGGLMRRKTQKSKDVPSPPVKDETDVLHAEAEKARKAALQAKAEAEKARLEAKKAKEEAERAHAEVEAAKAERAKLEKERKKQASKENRKSGLSLFGFGGGANKKDGDDSLAQSQAQEKSAAQNDGFVLVSGHKGNSTDSSPADSQIAPEILAAIEVGEPRVQKTAAVTPDKPSDAESSAVAADKPKESSEAAAKNAPPVPAKDAAAAAAVPTATASHSSGPSSAQEAPKDEGKAPKKLGRVASLWHGKGNANGNQSAPESSGSGARRSLSSRKSSSKEAAGKLVEEVIEEVDGVQRKFIRVTNPPRGAGKSASAVQWRG